MQIESSGKNPGKDPRGLEKQHKHHDRGDIADHDRVELLPPERVSAAFHLLDDEGRLFHPADENSGQETGMFVEKGYTLIDRLLEK